VVVQASAGAGEPDIHQDPGWANHCGLAAEVVADQAPCPARHTLEVEVVRTRQVARGEVHTHRDDQEEGMELLEIGLHSQINTILSRETMSHPGQVDIHAAVEVGYMAREADFLV
jgi:hypothetical protein